MFCRWTRFFVFITSHSDPTNGFLHIAPNNAASVPMDEVCKLILYCLIGFANRDRDHS